ncbi:hypothetical protein [Dyella sp.]|jgi:hypothetical protein|uniref:hypothetical protein n=1 Tax=Dyella sp. TaxID=1869338 RepID=UPI002D77B0CC|nr:hypothetical protein [Dyella sp.]HET6432351.1 hypothetical protein [Dyella sp.]
MASGFAARRSRQALALGLAASALFAMAPAFGALDPAGAAEVLGEAEAICTRDAGAFWGHSLCGPMVLVDPIDRDVVANRADGRGVLKPSGAFFAGTLPASVILANTSIEWSGIRWSEILWPGPGDADQRHVMLAHEMFHRIQPALKMTLPEGDNRHLDTLEGRYLIQLEWRALAAALRAPTTTARRQAVADALLFRNERYRLFPAAATNENDLEANEGIAEYTGTRLGLTTSQARIRYALHDLTAFVQAPSFVRSFAYATGPAYGLLLDQADPGWHSHFAPGQRLDQLLGEALRLPPPAFATLKARKAAYDDGTLRTSEVKRDEVRRAHLAELTAKLVDGPVLVLPLDHSSLQFNPQTLVPLGDLGTVYPTLRLDDDWGVLEVDGDARVDQQAKIATVSAAGIGASDRHGHGWKLTLSPGWVVVPGARKGDLAVKRGGNP